MGRELDGRVALVTGASSGIGAAVARRLAAGGAAVALLARRKELVEAVAAECGGLAVPADVTDHASLVAAAAEVRDRLGPPDLVVVNAGMLVVDPLLDESADRLAALVSTNVTGAAWTARLFAGDLRAAAGAGGPADLVFVGSPSGAEPVPLMSVYGASKAAVNQLAVVMRDELAPAGVRVHNVEPSWTLTELSGAYASGVMELAGRDPHLVAAVPRPDPAVVPLQPADIAAVLAYAISAPAEVNLAHVRVVPTRLA
jgi:NADP-dependent 3-hydroxy acid dehydrogenase YdfG